MQVTPKSDRQLNLQVLSELIELQEIEIENEKLVLVMQGTVTEELYTPDKEIIANSYEKELAWILTRPVQQYSEIQQVPGWSGFNQIHNGQSVEELKNVVTMHTQADSTHRRISQKSLESTWNPQQNVPHVGGKRSFRRNHCRKYIEMQGVKSCHTFPQTDLRGIMEGLVASSAKVGPG